VTGNFSEWGQSFWNPESVRGGGRLGQFVLGLVFIGVGTVAVVDGNSAAWLLVGVGVIVATFPVVWFIRRRLRRR
jgi:hypothetical protein